MADDLLKEIRESYTYYTEEQEPIRREARTDMRYVSGDSWDPKERQARMDADRPCLSFDELNQYLNALINEPRQNKRAIKIAPKGGGANDQSAELLGNIIREIEYDSRAQAAYTTAFQGAAERSYGYTGVGARYVEGGGFEQELYIRRIPNPDSVIFHPNYKQLDASDAMGCFVLDKMRRTDFQANYPKAQTVDFAPEHQRIAPDWVTKEDVLIAEYWKVRIEDGKTLHLVEGEDGGLTEHFEDELPDDFDFANLSKRQRRAKKRVVTQYITNGVEILDETEIPIPWIPIVPCFGKELYIDRGSGAKRELLSLIRLARDPQMYYNFIRSQQAEEGGMAPKAPYIGFTGQFKTHEDEWATANKVPRAFLQADLIYDQNGQAVTTLPQRQAFTPNFAAFEAAAEASRRAIQAAIGNSSLPTAAQRRNEKSGVALKEIESEEDRGSFHFIDNYNFMIEHIGRILVAWLPHVLDTEREIGIRTEDGKHKRITVNAKEPDENGQTYQLSKEWQHGVTVSVGPSSESQRQEASDFLDTLIANLKNIPAPPPQLAKLLSLAIRMKQLGHFGEQMAETISPPDNTAGALQQAQQQAQAQMQEMQAMKAELDQLKLEKAGRVIDNQFKMQLEGLKAAHEQRMEQLANDIKVLIAEVQAKAQDQEQRTEMFMTFWKENHGAAHEAAMQTVDNAHDAKQALDARAAEATAAAQAQSSAGGGVNPQPGASQ